MTTTRELRRAARRAISMIDDLLKDRRVLLTGVSVSGENDIGMFDTGEAMQVMHATGDSVITISLAVRRHNVRLAK